MKKIICVLLALILCLASLPLPEDSPAFLSFAQAEETDGQDDGDDDDDDGDGDDNDGGDKKDGGDGKGPVGSPVIPPHTHEGGTATCTKPAVCDRCGQPYGEPLGHVEETVPAVEATCTQAGYSEYAVCARCGEWLTARKETAALGHDWGSWTNVEYRTITNKLTQRCVCKRNASHAQWRYVKLKKNAKLPNGTIVKDGNKTYELSSGALILISVNPGNLKSIKVPDTVTINGVKVKVTTIATNAFKNCGRVKTIKLGKNVRTIKAGAFTGCKSLTTLNICATSKVSFNKAAFKGLSKSRKQKIKIHVNKKMTNRKYKALKKSLQKAGAKSGKISKDLAVK